MPKSIERESGTAEVLQVIPVIEERVEIDRRAIDAGSGVRLRKLIHERIAEVDLELGREELSVTRVPINKVLDSRPAIRHEGDITVIPVFEEREITVKQLVLVEEILIKRIPRVERKTEPVKLRREEVIVERQDRLTGEWIVCESDRVVNTADPARTDPPPPVSKK